MENSWSFYSKINTKKDVDLFSCLLVEASGDSEADFDPNVAINKDLADDDDDAQSCSCDVSDDCYSCVADLNACNEVEQASIDHVVDDYKDEEEKQDKKEEPEVHGYQEWANGHLGLTVDQKSCVSVESTNEPMNEMEKNRLFWETCLAS
ncbi:hypothetical protein P3X46_003140 [Hevea brasiliensis]|uniref:Uncharacterized protein n=1 Tax=Hevea brasiliensis TaxID=3981 RepID=A0ABQ9N7X3_HEVBR|nr:uncharacterized protein LOC110665591 [Hevea brasiliensis]KAJ9187716.1 hypothetical protein P3X46_003140 [Hevea brasiliensis]